VGLDVFDEASDLSPCFVDGSLLGIAHPVFDLGESLFDRIEVGRIGRQKPQPGAGGADGAPDRRAFVAAEIIHHDDVALFERGDELLLDPGAKTFAIDRTVEDAGRVKPVAAQRAEKSQRAPVAVRREAAQRLAFLPPAAQRRHVGLDPGLVDEDETPWIEPPLQRAPALALSRNVGASLLKREQRFF